MKFLTLSESHCICPQISETDIAHTKNKIFILQLAVLKGYHGKCHVICSNSLEIKSVVVMITKVTIEFLRPSECGGMTDGVSSNQSQVPNVTFLHSSFADRTNCRDDPNPGIGARDVWRNATSDFRGD